MLIELYYDVGISDFVSRRESLAFKALGCELEVPCLVFGQVGEVKGNTHQIGLGSVIFLVVITVNDQLVAIFFRSRNVLEVIEVEGVGENVVAMDTLKRPALGHRD